MDISIIIPTYNVKKYIRCTLNSIVNQPIDNYEIIVIDDGSTDSTYEIINEYSERYKNIYVEKIEYSRGPGKARNIGIEKAKGKYIYFVDGDDFIPCGVLEKIYKFAEEKGSDIAIGKIFFKNNDFYYTVETIDWIFEEKNSENRNFRDLPALKFLQGPTAKLFKKDYLYKIGFKFSEDTYFEDFPVIGLAYYLTNKIFLLEDFVYGVRIRDENIDPSITQSLSDEQTKKDLDNMKKLEIELMQKHNINRSQKQLDFEEFVQNMKRKMKEENKEYKDLYKAIDQNEVSKWVNQFI